MNRSVIYEFEKCRDLEIGNRGQRSLEVIRTDTYRSATYDFLLTFHRNNGPISHRFRGRPRFQSKVAKIFTPVYFAPLLTRFPLEFAIGTAVRMNRNDGAISKV